MVLRVFDTKDQLASAAATFISDNLLTDAKPLLCAASGDTPSGTYKKIIEYQEQGKFSIDNCFMLSLDEWTGLNSDDPGSCGYSIKEQLTAPLDWPDTNTCFFDGRASDLKTECLRVERYLDEKGPITVAILGLGLNGHIGLNEPGTDPALRSHITSLDPSTAKTGQKYFDAPQELNGGVTLGIANLLEAKHLLLLVTGAHKREIVKRLINSELDPLLPCTHFKEHPSFHVYIDQDAAGSSTGSSLSM